ncbi:MAG: hypothetical protein AAGU04_04825 [Anaerolineaceae bacterium]
MLEEHSGNSSKRWYADTQLIILAIFFAALFLRMVNLGQVPFNSEEAQNAYAALSTAKGTAAGTAVSPVYEGLTALTFFLARANPFFARFWPALAGASLALVPLLWRHRLGALQALLLALALAFDPVLFTLSRQAGGAILTAVGLIWAFSFLIERKPLGLGIMLAVAWLSGAWFWISALVCVLGVGLFMLFTKERSAQHLLNQSPFRDKAFREGAIPAFLVSLALLTTAFLLNPAGLGGLAGSLAAFWQSGQGAAAVTPVTSIYRLFAYSLPVILLAIPAVTAAWKEKNPQGQILSLLTALLFLSLLLVRSQGTAGFALLQCLLWPFAVVTLTKQIRLEAGQKDVALAGFFLGIGICGYLAISANNLLNPAQTALTIGKSAIAFILGLLLLVLIFILIMMGWSLQTARKGILSAVLLSLLAFSFSLTFLALKATDLYPGLVWSDSNLKLSASAQASLLREIEKTGKLEPQVSRVVITDPRLADLRWDFRDYQRVEVSTALPELRAPEIILSSSVDQEKVAETYRGIAIVNPGSVNWREVPIADLLRAAVSKKLPAESNEYYLWIRQDLMTGAIQ